MPKTLTLAAVPWPCEPGIAKGRPFWMAPDFDAPLDDFAGLTDSNLEKSEMTTMSLADVQTNLAELITQHPGEELIIERDGRTVAKLSVEPVEIRKPRKAGNCVGLIRIVADDDEHLADFAESME